jgi:DNA mismatch endonuclease (patch repair protein)
MGTQIGDRWQFSHSFAEATRNMGKRHDVLDHKQRSHCMASVGGKNTQPEMIIRRGLHARGFRYVLHSDDLPGKPDIVFPSRHAVILVHGCFWHGHGCNLFKWPLTNKAFWHQKINQNLSRDRTIRQALLKAGWRVGVVWGCALKGKFRRDLPSLFADIERWLYGNRATLSVEAQSGKSS